MNGKCVAAMTFFGSDRMTVFRVYDSGTVVMTHFLTNGVFKQLGTFFCLTHRIGRICMRVGETALDLVLLKLHVW